MGGLLPLFFNISTPATGRMGPQWSTLHKAKAVRPHRTGDELTFKGGMNLNEVLAFKADYGP
jgi:hypothetical protein